MPRANNLTVRCPTGLSEAVAECRRQEAVASALAELYARIDEESAAAGATCLGGGVCCKIDLTGQRLYLTTVELALLARTRPARGLRAGAGRCAYQVGPRCTARDRRPLGCRAFFCRPQLRDWSGRTYERYHRHICRLHERYHLPYAYVELTAALAELFGGEVKIALTGPAGTATIVDRMDE